MLDKSATPSAHVPRQLRAIASDVSLSLYTAPALRGCASAFDEPEVSLTNVPL